MDRPDRPTIELGDAPDEAYDALAELFLGVEDQGAAQAVEPASGVEALVLGHLPVFASAWVTQYARERSRELRAPVALLRVYAGHTSVELIGDVPTNRPAHDELYSALEEAGRRAGAWLVRVDETSEPELVSGEGIGRVTLLAGADEAAVVAAYRTIKTLLGPEGDGDVGVAILGAGRERAEAAGEKIRRAAEAFLSRHVDVRLCASKVTPSPARTLYRGRAHESVSDLVGLVAGVLARSAPTRSVPERGPEPNPEQAHKPIEPETVGEERSRPVVVDLLELEGGTPLHVDDGVEEEDKVFGQAGPRATSAMLRDGPVPGERTVPGAASAVVCFELGTLSEQVGLEAIGAVCPYAVGVELARDGHGRLHLVARANEGRERAVEQLTTAAGWARDHAGLLRMAVGGLEPQRPELHLVTDDAGAARRLIDAGVRVHLLTRVRVGDRTGWVCVKVG